MTDAELVEQSSTSIVTDPPRGLKPVLHEIPDRCYERSTIRGLGLLLRDTIIYGLAIWGLLSTDNPLLLVPLWIVAGIGAATLFVVGHDAAHDALFDSKRLNRVVARVAMLPSLHATTVWVFGHNRVHHGHTLRQGFDFVWHPLTVEQYQAKGAIGRAQHRFEWGPFGSGAYYLREVWWNKMVRFALPHRWKRRADWDKALVSLFIFSALALAVALNGGPGVWIWVKVIVIPFLLFCQLIGWVVYVHHIAPDIRWWSRSEWNRFRGQVEGTTILWSPPGVDALFHWIMIHLPHHVDMRIPCYRLPLAAKSLAEAFPSHVKEEKLRIRSYFQSVKACKLHNFETGEWLPYPSE